MSENEIFEPKKLTLCNWTFTELQGGKLPKQYMRRSGFLLVEDKDSGFFTVKYSSALGRVAHVFRREYASRYFDDGRKFNPKRFRVYLGEKDSMGKRYESMDRYSMQDELERQGKLITKQNRLKKSDPISTIFRITHLKTGWVILAARQGDFRLSTMVAYLNTYRKVTHRVSNLGLREFAEFFGPFREQDFHIETVTKVKGDSGVINACKEKVARLMSPDVLVVSPRTKAEPEIIKRIKKLKENKAHGQSLSRHGTATPA